MQLPACVARSSCDIQYITDFRDDLLHAAPSPCGGVPYFRGGLMSVCKKYTVRDVDLSSIRNRNEVRVIRAMREVLATKSAEMLLEKDLKDIYALSLNQMPAHYTQFGTIVLDQMISSEDVNSIVLHAYEQVVEFPKP